MPAIYKNGVPYAGSIGSAQVVVATDPDGNPSNVQSELDKDSEGIKNITRSGTTFTATRVNGTTFSFTQQDNNTTYTGTSPISVSGTTVSHTDSGVTSGAKGDTSNQTPAFGGTFHALSGTVNATGHLTAFAAHTVKIPNTAATTAAAGLMSASDKAKLASIATSATRNASNATTAAAGLMSAADKIKLNSIATSATRNKAPNFYDDFLVTSSTTLSTNTDKRLSVINMPAGTNIIMLAVRFGASSVGRRSIWLSTSTNASASCGGGIMLSNVQNAMNSGTTMVQLPVLIWVNSATTYYLNGYQNSGGDLNVDVRAVCLQSW